jgi:hypothetical protein
MLAELVLVRREPIETAVEPVIVDFGKRDAGDVFEWRAFIPVLRDAQFRTLRTKPGVLKDCDDVLPRNLLFARLDERSQKLAKISRQAPAGKYRFCTASPHAPVLPGKTMVPISPAEEKKFRLGANCGTWVSDHCGCWVGVSATANNPAISWQSTGAAIPLISVQYPRKCPDRYPVLPGGKFHF